MAKIKWTILDPYPSGVVSGFQAINRRLGIPKVGDAGPVAPKVAAVGGGPSVMSRLDMLRDWDGEIWGINATWRWLREQGIDATFFSVDPGEQIIEWARGAEKAILADTVNPKAFDVVGSAEIAWLGPGGIPNDCSSAATAFMVMAERGHKHITYFGCDCSFGERTHVYRHEDDPDRVRVVVDGEAFMSRSDLLVIAEALSGFARDYPSLIAVEGDGLLPALVRHGDYDITHVSRSLDERLVRSPA